MGASRRGRGAKSPQATTKDSHLSAIDQTRSAWRPASRASPDARAFPVPQNKTEKTGADTSAAKNARSSPETSRASSPPAPQLALLRGTKLESSPQPTPARRSTSLDEQDFPQTRRSAHLMPPNIPAPPIRMLRTLPTLLLLPE